MQLDLIKALVEPDLKALDKLISESLSSQLSLISQLSSHIFKSGGKRLRPLLVLLTARATGRIGQPHLTLAAIIEFIHTATLLHDDVVDSSQLRRGVTAAHQIWGNEAAILVGDFLYSRAFQLLAELENPKIMKLLSAATTLIAEGEVLQLLNRHNADLDEEGYLDVIYGKTAKLFEVATQLGAVLNRVSSPEEHSWQTYGKHLGIAFQLIDDVLDYQGAAAETGKNPGIDLAEGKVTLPLIYLLKHGSARDQELARKSIKTGDQRAWSAIALAVEKCGGIEYTMNFARQHAEIAIQALSGIPANIFSDAAIELASFAVERVH